MKWLKPHADTLAGAGTATFRFIDNSMRPDIQSGQEVVVDPVDPATVVVDDFIICRQQRGDFFYKVLALGTGKCKVGSARRTAGWVQNSEILGKLTSLTPVE